MQARYFYLFIVSVSLVSKAVITISPPVRSSIKLCNIFNSDLKPIVMSPLSIIDIVDGKEVDND